MTKQILCTLGPASSSERVIRRLESCGASLFRINLSHTKLADVERTVRSIQQFTDLPICLDTEGAQVRTGDFVNGSVQFRANTTVRAHLRRVPADDRNFNFYPADIIDSLKVGDFISIDFNSVLVQVLERGEGVVSMRVLNGGVVGQNKAVTIERDVELPPLTAKDRGALAIGVEMGLKHFALSFANHGEDVDEVRKIVGEDAFVISKIESRLGLDNLEAISARSNALLIDRGDLSRQVPLEQVPRTQKSILERAKKIGIKVYVATNLLESMVTLPVPTRAEVNDIYNTLVDGADGLVLAAETAVGNYPIECASMIRKMIKGFEASEHDSETLYRDDPVSMLVQPHGGQLVHGEAEPEDLEGIESLPFLKVPRTVLMDCEQLANGTYSPLSGFMDQETLQSVLDHSKLPSGIVWTMPILLQGTAAELKDFRAGQRVALRSESGEIHALIDISEIYTPDMDSVLQGFFGTTSSKHPGVARTRESGDTFVGGSVKLVKPLPSPYRHYQLSPAQTRFIFSRLGWSQVVGFHGRNPAHRGHEAIQLEALRRSGADGLYINPVIGPKRAGDFLPEPIILSYRTMLEFGCYPDGRAVLGCFSTYSRYAGPREAVFTALCRKNMGCSHFIIGRDHTGVGDFYPREANERYFAELGDIGIEPVFFDPVGFNPTTGTYDSMSDAEVLPISGTQIREALVSQTPLEEWIMRDIVQDVLTAEVAAGRPLFCE